MSAEPVSAWELQFARYRQTLLVRGYSEHTLRTLATYFHRWHEYITEVQIHQPEALTGEAVRGFQQWLWHRPTAKGEVRGVAGQNQILSFIKLFFAWLVTEGVLTRNPAAGLRYAKQPDPLPKDVLTPEEAAKVIEAPDTSTPRGYRDRAILETMYATGLRRAELRALAVADVDLESEVVIVRRGKGGKGRVVPLTRTACAYLETYLKTIRPQLLGSAKSTRLFVSMVNHPGEEYGLGVHALGRLVARYAKAVGIKKKVTPHLWRHTCATHLLQNRANVRHVQEMLGHKSLATTERYLRLTIDDLKEAHRLYHPRG
jgi:integrase/recombinase XerD